MEKDMISVVVPVYNVELYLDKCINSILVQSFENIEIILVDDGSTDDSGNICDRYVAIDNRVKVIHKDNGGLSDARNVGIRNARGEWLAFIDSDDYITSDALEQLYTAAVENDCQIGVCNMVRIYEDGEKESFYNPTEELIVLEGNNRFETLNQPSVCNKLFKAELFKKVHFPKGKYYEDTFIYHKLVYQASRIVLTGLDSYYYLSRRGSILDQKKYTDRYFDMVEAVYERVKFLLDHQIYDYGKQACLSLYAITANAEKYLMKTTANAEKFKQMRIWYQEAYDYLIFHANIGIKQKVRLFLLRYIPKLHGKIY